MRCEETEEEVCVEESISLHVHTYAFLFPVSLWAMAWKVIDGMTEVVQMSQTIICVKKASNKVN